MHYEIAGRFMCERRVGVYYTFRKDQDMSVDEYMAWSRQKMDIMRQALPFNERIESVAQMTDQMGFSHPLGYSGVFSVNIPANGRPEFVHLVALCPDQLGAVMVENSPLNEAQLQNPHSVNVSCNAPYMRGPYYAQRREGS